VQRNVLLCSDRMAEDNHLPSPSSVCIPINRNVRLPNCIQTLLVCHKRAVNVEAPVSEPLPLPIVLPPLTVAAPGQRFAPTGLKLQQLGLVSWNLDRVNQKVISDM
jgi:hypothetical protein